MDVTPTGAVDDFALSLDLLPIVPLPLKYGLAALAVICSMRFLTAAIRSAVDASIVGGGGMAAGPAAAVDEVGAGAGAEVEAEDEVTLPEEAFADGRDVDVEDPDATAAFPARRACIAALLAAIRALMSSILYDGGFSFLARFASG